MRCDNCGREVEGYDFANHYLFCRRSYARAREATPPVREAKATVQRFQPLNAKRTESLANRYAEGMPLRFASASKASVFLLSDGKREYLVDEWTFVYAQADTEWITVQFDAENVGVDRSSNMDGPSTKRGLHYMAKCPPITNWSIDSGQACALVERQGGQLQAGGGIMGGVGLFQLRMANVDGKDVPLWWVPHRLQWFPVFVRADTGALAFNNRGDNQLLFTEALPPGLGTIEEP